MRKLIIPIFLLILMPLTVNAFLLIEDFTKSINNSYWQSYRNESLQSNLTIINNEMVAQGNLTSSLAGVRPALNANISTYFINSTNNGTLYFDYRINTIFTINHMFFAYLRHPSDYSGGIEFYIAGNTNKILVNDHKINDIPLDCFNRAPAQDLLTHNVRIDVIRNATGTIFNTYFDGVFFCTIEQLATFTNLYLNFSYSALVPTLGSTSVSFDNILFSNYLLTSYTPPTINQIGCDTCDPLRTQCLAYTNFAYEVPISKCGWTDMYRNLVPPNGTTGGICFDSNGTSQDFRWDLNQNFFGAQAWQEDFGMSIQGSASVEHGIYMHDSVEGRLKVGALSFWNDSSSTYIDYQYFDRNRSLVGTQSLCTNCFTLEQYNTYQFRIFGPDATTFSQYDPVNHTYLPNKPNTISLQINGAYMIKDIPLLKNVTGDTFIPYSVGWSVFDHQICLNAIEITSLQTQTQNTTVPIIQVGDYCKSNSECLTGWCEAAQCSRKPGGESCVNYYDCLSRQCVNGRCNSADLWLMLDQSKNQMVGTSTNTNLFFCMVLIIVIDVIIVMSMASLGAAMAGAIIALVVSVFLTMFFTIIGWLSPIFIFSLILVGMIIFSFITLMNGR